MGNFYFSRSNPDVEDVIDDDVVDDLKTTLIERIKNLNPQKITNILANSKAIFSEIELTEDTLIPMTIELYEKLFSESQKYPTIDDVNVTNKIYKKRMFYVKPQFTNQDVYDEAAKSIPRIDECELVLLDVEISPARDVMNTGVITITEYDNSFKVGAVKRDMMGINKIILGKMPNYFKLRFINTFNNVYETREGISDIAFAKCSYIYKVAKAGPKNDISSFRQILAIPNIVNHFHRILYLRLNEYMMNNGYINIDIQKGGISGQKYSIFEQFFKIKNVLGHANKNNKPCSLLFLDITNAFGSVSLTQLYNILSLYGVDDNLVKYIKAYYDNLEYYVHTSDISTNLIQWRDGLMQGCPLSALLFVIVLNYILSHINNKYRNTHGYDYNGSPILLTAYVDDICVICRDNTALNTVYQELQLVLSQFGLQISNAKTMLMEINTIGNSDVNKVFESTSCFKYLGQYIHSSGDYVPVFTQYIKSIQHRLIKLSNCRNPEVIPQVFNTVILPWIRRSNLMMYDLPIDQKAKILSIIQQFATKWNFECTEIFANHDEIIKRSNDTFIQDITPYLDFDDCLVDELDIKNYMTKNITFTYDDITEDEEIDQELELLNNLTRDNNLC